jgi:hypothetical protein
MLVASDSHREFKIVADAGVGFYLYVFEGGKCTYDYLQDSEELAKKCAADLFQVPLTSWLKKGPIQPPETTRGK